MILGRVNDNREAIVQLALRGNENQLRLFDRWLTQAIRDI